MNIVMLGYLCVSTILFASSAVVTAWEAGDDKFLRWCVALDVALAGWGGALAFGYWS